MHRWQSSAPQGRVRVVEASCCEEYVLCLEAAQYFVRRRAGDGGFEETARGSYVRAFRAWTELDTRHRCPGAERAPVFACPVPGQGALLRERTFEGRGP